MKRSLLFSGIGKDILIVVIGVILIWSGLRVAFGTENPFYVVSSGSMEPELEVFDVLIVQGNEQFDGIEKGEIIVFNRPSDHDRVIVHRVIDILDEDPRTLKTKGDSNPASIPGTDFPITEEEYIGKVVYVIPQIGYVTRILSPPMNYIIIAVIIGIMIFTQVNKNRKKRLGAIFGDNTDEEQSESKENLFKSDEFSSLKDSEYTKNDESKSDLDSKSNEPENNSDSKDTKEKDF